MKKKKINQKGKNYLNKREEPPNGENLRDARFEENEAIWQSRYDAVTAEEEEEACRRRKLCSTQGLRSLCC